MKTRILFVLCVIGLTQFSYGMGMLRYRIGILPEQIIDEPFSGTARTDATIDGTTIEYQLTDDFSSKWSFRTKHAESGSKNINNEAYDLKLGEDLYFQFQMFSKLSPSAVKYMIIQGAELKNVHFDYSQNTIDVTVQPTMAAITSGNNQSGYAGLSMDFYYNNLSEDNAYGVPIIVTDSYLDDTSRLSASTPLGFKGSGLNINGLNNERVNFTFLLGARYLAEQNLQFDQLMGFVDGMMPANGFSMSGPMDPGFTVDLGQPTETFKVYLGYNLTWSPHDIQLGVFPQPLSITTSSKENDGFHIVWNNENGKTYTVESTDNLGIPFAEKAASQVGPEYVDTTATGGNRFYRIKEE